MNKQKNEAQRVPERRAGDTRLSPGGRSAIALVLSAVVCIATIWSVLSNVRSQSAASLTPPETEATAAESQSTEQPKPTQPEVEPANPLEGIYNLLLAGTDEEDMQVDTLMILQLDTNKGKTVLLSIPRETLIFGNYSVPKISTVYGNAGGGEKGATALINAVTDVIGFPLDGYVIQTPDQFRQLVDKLSGVDFDVPRDMTEEEIELEEGTQHLDGATADALMRFRDYEEENAERPEVQQDFLRALFARFQETGETPEGMASQIKNLMKTDLDSDLLIHLLDHLLTCDPDSLQGYTLPGEDVTIRGAEYYQLDEEAILKLINKSCNPLDRDLTQYDIFIRTKDDFGGTGYVPDTDDYTAWLNSLTENTSPGSEVGPADPTWLPSESEDPSTDPVDPSATVEPSQWFDPSESADPTDPTDFTDPTDPLEPTDPTDPTDAPPTDPVQPDPVEPTTPEPTSGDPEEP